MAAVNAHVLMEVPDMQLSSNQTFLELFINNIMLVAS